VKTPCIKVCKVLDGKCLGCGRTLEQIRLWSKYTEEEREKLMSSLKSVTYTGDHPTIRKGTKALMDKSGKVQLDGPQEGWRASERIDPRCFGWHDLGKEWKDNE